MSVYINFGGLCGVVCYLGGYNPANQSVLTSIVVCGYALFPLVMILQTNGQSNGLVPMLRVYNNTARYVDQGGNKRPGAFAIYLEPWHADVFDFLDLRKNHGSEEKVC